MKSSVLIFAFFLCLQTGVAFSEGPEDSEITIVGAVGAGQLDSSIDPEHGKGVVFVSESDVGNKIFKVCGAEDTCEVKGKITGKYRELVSVSSVRLIKRAYQ